MQIIEAHDSCGTLPRNTPPSLRNSIRLFIGKKLLRYSLWLGHYAVTILPREDKS